MLPGYIGGVAWAGDAVGLSRGRSPERTGGASLTGGLSHVSDRRYVNRGREINGARTGLRILLGDGLLGDRIVGRHSFGQRVGCSRDLRRGRRPRARPASSVRSAASCGSAAASWT